MKIDLPITILFDCQATDHQSIARAAGSVVCTLRYDTDSDGRDAVLFGSYPPSENADLGEPAQAVLAFIPAKTDAKVTARAKRSPYDYAVGTEEERTVWQEESDEQRAQDGQFGAGV